MSGMNRWADMAIGISTGNGGGMPLVIHGLDMEVERLPARSSIGVTRFSSASELLVR